MNNNEKINIMFGTLSEHGWFPNPHLKMSEEEQFIHNKENGFDMFPEKNKVISPIVYA